MTYRERIPVNTCGSTSSTNAATHTLHRRRFPGDHGIMTGFVFIPRLKGGGLLADKVKTYCLDNRQEI